MVPPLVQGLSEDQPSPRFPGNCLGMISPWLKSEFQCIGQRGRWDHQNIVTTPHLVEQETRATFNPNILNKEKLGQLGTVRKWSRCRLPERKLKFDRLRGRIGPDGSRGSVSPGQSSSWISKESIVCASQRGTALECPKIQR